MTASLHAFLDALVPSSPTRLGPITLLPLQAPARGPEVTLLEPDTTRITEKGHRGIVGEVDVHNPARLPLLLLAGEILVGAKQNRIVNASTLVGAGSTQSLNVSCVEQGRWAFGRGSSGFRSGRTTAPWAMRSRSCRSASRSKRRRGESRSDQGEVWSHVRQHLSAQAVHSSTMDLTEAIEKDRVRIAEALEGWTPGPDDVGAALFVGDRLVGVEAFGRPETWAAAAARVLAGVVQERPARDIPPEDPAGAWATLRERVRALELAAARGDGLGEELHGESGQTHLVALMDGDAVVHLRVADGLASDPDGTDDEDPRLRRWAEREARRRRRSLSAAAAAALQADARQLELARVEERAARREAARRVRARVERTDDPVLVIDRPTIVARARAHKQWHHRSGDTMTLPLPRRIAGGVAAWPLPDLETAEALLAVIERIGTPSGAYLLIDPADPPDLDRRRWLALHQPEPGVLHARCVG